MQAKIKSLHLENFGKHSEAIGGKPLDIRHIRPSSTSAFPVEEKEIVRSCVQPRTEKNFYSGYYF